MTGFALYKISLLVVALLLVVVVVLYSSLISYSTIYELSVLHVWECNAMTRNVVKRLANQNGVNCLFYIIGQSNMLIFYGTEKIIYLGAEDCQE